MYGFLSSLRISPSIRNTLEPSTKLPRYSSWKLSGVVGVYGSSCRLMRLQKVKIVFFIYFFEHLNYKNIIKLLI